MKQVIGRVSANGTQMSRAEANFMCWGASRIGLEKVGADCRLLREEAIQNRRSWPSTACLSERQIRIHLERTDTRLRELIFGRRTEKSDRRQCAKPRRQLADDLSALRAAVPEQAELAHGDYSRAALRNLARN